MEIVEGSFHFVVGGAPGGEFGFGVILVVEEGFLV